MDGVVDFLRTSFLHVLPIILAGIFASAIIVERIRALFTVYPIQNEEGFFERIRDLVMDGKVAEAVAICDRYPNKPVAQVVRKGLLRAHQPESLIENGLELAVEESAVKVQKRTSYLGMVANVATLLGLLGTIAGLVVAFKGVGALDAAARTQHLATGISQAMYATMFGLGVAIPCMVAFSFLMNRANRIMSNIDVAAVRILDIIKQRYFEAESRAMNQGHTYTGMTNTGMPGQGGQFGGPTGQ